MEIKFEENQEFTFETIKNDKTMSSMKKLIDLKNIFAKQLPKMPKEYIIRLLFDSKHECIIILDSKGELFGGVCYCSFTNVKLIEIVFLAVKSEKQVKGFGTKIMNYLKFKMQSKGAVFLMTCADNLAIGYFKKQGFHTNPILPIELYKGYLKDYEGSTLMECLIDPDIDYINICNSISNEKNHIINKIKNNINNDKKYDGILELDWQKSSSSKYYNKFNTLISPESIKGLIESGFTFNEFIKIQSLPTGGSFQNSCLKILDQLTNHKASWPFLYPVKKEEVPDYFDIIKNPIDFQSIKEKVNSDLYLSRNEFISDIKLIYQNARTYNVKTTIYYKYANELEKFSDEIFINLKEINEINTNNNNKEIINVSQKIISKNKKLKL